MAKGIFVSGERFGRLVTTEEVRIRGFGVRWKCRCDCGNEIIASPSNLKSGNSKSCGCYFREVHRTHGKTHSRAYNIWKSMRYRCSSPNAHEYQNYGGRGIFVCERWQSFDNFYADMSDPPAKYTLERIDNERGYEPGNCRWATYSDQLNNRRNNHVVEAFGRKQTLTQWSTEMKIPFTTLKNRILRAKLSPEEALTVRPYYKQRP